MVALNIIMSISSVLFLTMILNLNHHHRQEEMKQTSVQLFIWYMKYLDACTCFLFLLSCKPWFKLKVFMHCKNKKRKRKLSINYNKYSIHR